MANATISHLCSPEALLQENSLAIVTHEFVILKSTDEHSHTIIPLAQLTGMRRITTTYPAMLVIAAALGLIGAAAFCSKQGSGAGLPVALLAVVLAAGYFLSRRAAVAFLAGSEITETMAGSPGEATKLIKAVRAAQERLTGVE